MRYTIKKAILPTVLIILIFNCGFSDNCLKPQKGYYYAKETGQNSQYALYVQNYRMKYECITPDSTYTTDYFKFRNFDRNLFYISDSRDLFYDLSFTCDTVPMSDDLQLSDSTLLNIIFPKLDCSYIITLNSKEIKDNFLYSFSGIDSISIPLKYNFDDPDLYDVYDTITYLSGIDKKDLYLGIVTFFFIWPPEQMISNPYLPEQLQVDLVSNHYSYPFRCDTIFNRIRSINISLDKLNQYLINNPCFRSQIFEVFPGRIKFGDLEFIQSKNIDKLLKQRR